MNTSSSIAVSAMLAVSICAPVAAQEPAHPDLPAIAAAGGVFNRTAAVLDDGDRRGLHLDARPGDGIAWVPGVTMEEGVIDVAVRGRDRPGQSFLGLAFRGQDDETYEAVYLRPFNFRSDDPARRAHAVQYISHPDHTWSRLRQEQPGRYEAPLDPAPEAEAWVRLRVVLDGSTVLVFVDDSPDPALVVDRIADRGEGRVGLWVGNGSEGDFADLRITPADPSP
jgi:hypothetical protein